MSHQIHRANDPHPRGAVVHVADSNSAARIRSRGWCRWIATSVALASTAAPSFAQESIASQRRPVQGAERSEFIESVERALPFARRYDGLLDVVAEAAQLMAPQSVPASPPAPANLTLNPLRLSLQHTGALTETDVLSLLEQAGISVDEIEPEPRPGWFLVRVNGGLDDDADWIAMVDEVSQHPDIECVAPVAEDGEEWSVPLRDVLLQLTESTQSTIQQVLLAHPGLVLVEEEFGGMPRAYRLRSQSPDGKVVLAQAAALADDGAVEWAEPDTLMSARLEHIPNDPGFANLWGFRNTGQYGGSAGFDMDVDAAWDTTKGVATVRVLILDTGTDGNHPDLNEAARMDFTGTALNVCDNHGTAVAGCVSAIIDNSLGTVGVAPHCPVLSARVFVSNSSCNGTGNVVASQYVNALQWGMAQGARISNASLSLNPASAISAQYNTTRSNGMVHFAAAGNNSASGSVYPGSLNSVQEVAALHPGGQRATFSNFSSNVVCAPGEFIYTTDRVGGLGYSSGNYVTTQGTSFASPYTAGIAALMRSVLPQLTPDDVESILRSTTTDLGASGRDNIYGWGMVNAQRAVAEAVRRLQCAYLGGACHPATIGYGGGNGAFAICSQTPLSCPGTVTLKLYNVPANQPAWIVLADQLQPTQDPLLAGYFVDPTPLAIVGVTTDSNGVFCLPDLSNCGTLPLFMQAMWVRPGQSTLGVSEVVRMDFGPLPVYEVGPNKMFGRIQDAMAAAQAPNPLLLPLVEVSSGTYTERLSWIRPLVIREAPGATAVLHLTGSTNHVMDLSGWDTPGFASWSGIDIVADGSIATSVIRVYASGSADINVTFSDMNISDVPGVSASGVPFFSVLDDSGSTEASVTLRDVNVQAVNTPYGPFFQVRNDSAVTVTSQFSGAQAAPGTRYTINTSAENLIDLQSTANPGFAIHDALIRQTAPREEMLVNGAGVLRAQRCKFELPAGAIGALRHDAGSGDSVLTQCLVDARNGTQQSVFRMPGGGTAGVRLADSAVLFDASATGKHAAIDASGGGRVFIERSTVSSTTSHAEACAVQGPTTPANPSVQLGQLTGAIHQSIFVLPGSHSGVVRSLMGRVALAHGAENIRRCAGGFPAESDLLPGHKYDLDPLLAADGYHLTAASAAALPKRIDLLTAGFDIDGVWRGPASSDFGCDHTPAGSQPGLHVGPGQTYATIQAAINAATAGATVVVHGGTYDEKVVWNKPVNIVEAWGETARLRPTSSSSGLYVIRQDPWPVNSDARWDGIDVEVAGGGNNDVIFVRGAGGSGAAVTRFENCRFTDVAAVAPGTSFFRVEGNGTFLSLESTIVDPQANHYFDGFYVTQPSYVTVKDSYVSFSAGKTANLSGGGQLTFDGCEIVDRGSEIMAVTGNGTSGTFLRTRVKTKVGRQTAAVATLGSGFCIVGVMHSFIDATEGAAATPFWFSTLSTPSMQSPPWLTMMNSAIVFHSGRTNSRCAIDASLGGKVSMLHCTVRNVQDEVQYQPFGSGIHGPAQANADLKGDFANNVFDLPGSADGAILNYQHTSPGTVSAFGNVNVVYLAGGSGLFDRLPGTKISANPSLASDRFHLTSQSNSTMFRAGSLNVSRDIEGDARPAAGAFQPNFGCDEILP